MQWLSQPRLAPGRYLAVLVLAVTAVLGTITAVFFSTSASAAETLLSQGRPVTASSVEDDRFKPQLAVDGDPGTRWASAWSDPQWLSVDLGSPATLSKVVLTWEGSGAKAFALQTSDDASTWKTIWSTTTGTGGTQSINVTGSGRYVRLNGTQRNSGYGYSLWEFQVYGSTGTQPPTDPTTPPTSPGTTPGSWKDVWSESFDGAAGTAPSATNWQVRTGTQYPGGAAHWGTGSVETATADRGNLSLDGNGRLSITALKDGSGAWTSGRIETKRDDFEAAPGEQLKFSAVLRQPDVTGALGYWPGFRATGAAYRTAFDNWPRVGESDIMTDVNGRDQLANTLHCGSAPGGPCNEYDGRTSGFASCVGCQSGYHEYSQVIDRTKSDEEVRFYLDGRQTWVVRESQVGVTAWNAAIHHGFYLRLDLSIGGSLPDALAGVKTPTAQTKSGGVLSVDSVSVQKTTAVAAPSALTDPATPAGPSVVKVTGTRGNWQLTANGQPWQIKGLTYGPPQGAADGYMRDLKNMGVNTVRTWGVDDAGSPELLNRAAQQGIKVIMGEWLNQGADYVNDTAYKNSAKASILKHVDALKNYQGLLMWDVGNEVILDMQNHGLTADQVEARRIAYAKFVNEVAVAIHAADPNHPVTSTDAYTGAWTYYKQYAPALDLLAVNAYGGVGSIKQAWTDGGYDKPYIVTEGGPAGEWEVPNDANGVPTEPSDLAKRDGYTASWNAILSHPGVALGATEFNYGLENDFGGIWLNTFTGGWRRLGYAALVKAYTGQPLPNTPPQIASLSVPASVSAGSRFDISAQVSDPDADPLRYTVMYSNHHVSGGGNGLVNVTFTQTADGRFTATAPATTGVWKVYVYAYDGHGNVGIESRSIKVV